MDWPTFSRTLRLHWLGALLLLYAGIFGSVVYSKATIQTKAAATVAVRDPLTVRPNDYQAAQITYDAIVSSRRLAERVAGRTGRSVDEVEASLGVSVRQSEAGLNISPLYVVSAEEPSADEATALVDVAVEEANELFVELNQVSADDVRGTLDPDLARARDELAARQAEFDRFADENDARNLEERLSAAAEDIDRLAARVSEARADLAGAAAIGEPAASAVVRERLQSFEAQLAVRSAERERMIGLLDQFRVLRTDLDRARDRVRTLDDLLDNAVASQLEVVESQVKVLDQAKVEPQTLLQILVIAVGVVLGTLAAVSYVYARATAAGRLETGEDIAEAVGAPLLGVIPASSVDARFGATPARWWSGASGWWAR